MAKSVDHSEPTDTATNVQTTMIQLSRRTDGTWEATQQGLEIVGTGCSAARATEDMARQIAEQQESREV